MFFLVLFLSIGFFGFGAESKTSEVIISAVQISGEKTDNDFVELYNPTCSMVDISGWKLRKRISSGSESSFRVFESGRSIAPKGYFLWANLEGDFDASVNADDSTKSILSSNYSLALFDKDDSIVPIDSMTWGNNTSPFSPTYLYPTNPLKGEVLLKNSEGKFSISSEYIPKNTAFKDETELEKCPKIEPKIYSSKITINEILPNPSSKDKGAEFVEFYNSSNVAENLEGWKLKDRKGISHELKKLSDDSSELLIGPLNFLAIDPGRYGMTLYNSNDSIELLFPDGKMASAVSYSGSAKENLSYGFDGSKWRWSQHLTPGGENIFDDEPNFKVIKDDAVFKNFPANFDVNIRKYKKSKTKITWDFGDGHKSYKKTTTHKYTKKGKYAASVKIFNGSEEVVKTFKVEVKDFPKYDVEIIAVNPNPDGRDSDFETVTVRNNSKKKVDLQNWSIATGDKKLTNHPIALKTVLKPKETLTITRALSKFTLNNKKAQVELRYPSGKVASKMKYDKKVGNIAEGEILEKSKLGWVWKTTAPTANVPQIPNVSQEANLLAAAPEIEQNLEMPQILGESDIQADVPPVEHLVGEGMLDGGQSMMKNQKDFKIVLASFVYAPFLIN